MATPRISQKVQEEILTPDEEQRRIAMLIADREQQRLAEEARAANLERVERGQKLVRRVIDPHEGRLATVTSSWEPLTPSMCLDADCSYDAAKERGFVNGYDSIPEDMVLPWNGKTARQDAEDLLAQHTAIAHSTAGPAHIRTPEQVRALRAQRPVPETFVTNPRLT